MSLASNSLLFCSSQQDANDNLLSGHIPSPSPSPSPTTNPNDSHRPTRTKSLLTKLSKSALNLFFTRNASNNGQNRSESEQIGQQQNLLPISAQSRPRGASFISNTHSNSNIRNLFAKCDPVTHFSVYLDNNRTVFLPGQRIEGSARVHLTEPVKVKLLRMRFTGYICTSPHKGDTELLSKSSSFLTIFKELHTAVGSAVYDDPEEIISPGWHSYPFSFRVPGASLPASFVGTFGKISYDVTAILVRKKFTNRTSSAIVTIPSTIDAGNEEFLVPMTLNANIPVGLWKNQGKVDVFASIPKKSYANEESIPLQLDISNMSSYAVVIQDISLKQKVLYRFGSEYRGPVTEKFQNLKYHEICAPESNSTRVINFPVPSTAVFSPSIRTTILEVKHYITLKVTATPSKNEIKLGRHKFTNISRSIKIVIPLIIAGFPHSIPENGRPSIDTLPEYVPREISEFVMERPCHPDDNRSSLDFATSTREVNVETPRTLTQVIASRIIQTNQLDTSIDEDEIEIVSIPTTIDEVNEQPSSNSNLQLDSIDELSPHKKHTSYVLGSFRTVSSNLTTVMDDEDSITYPESQQEESEEDVDLRWSVSCKYKEKQPDRITFDADRPSNQRATHLRKLSRRSSRHIRRTLSLLDAGSLHFRSTSSINSASSSTTLEGLSRSGSCVNNTGL
ncbi:Arrestin domain-containing protein 4 [Nowakowskiella sp. JEL0407]|nr:Arrestin domain-containing protein 4 [Nowakowskiella sp. JEL0407]